MSSTDNTLQNYITNYIKQTFTSHTDKKCNKLYKKLLNNVEEIIKLTINEAKNYDKNLEDLYHDPRFNKKFIQATVNHQVSKFLTTHSKKKEIISEFNNKHHINKSNLKILEERKDLVSKINDTDLTQQNKKSEDLNIRKTPSQSIKIPFIKNHKLEHSRELE